MTDFRYAQFCPLARASEILGERWTLPILRELLLGPQRFSDLRRRLPGLSSSVLAARLDRLERAEVVALRELPPPAASAVYTLTAHGRALAPALTELMRWGLRFLGLPAEGDHFEPDWPLLALEAFARRDASPARRFELRLLRPGEEPVVAHVAGGPAGTVVTRGAMTGPVNLRVSAPPLVVLGLLGGGIAPRSLRRRPDVTLEGDAAALDDFPRLFELAVSPEPAANPGSPKPAQE